MSPRLSKEEVRQFASSISMIGPRIIFDTRSHSIRRLIWLMLVCAGVVILGTQLFERLDVYYKRPVSAKYNLVTPASVDFPLITICNLNTIQMSFIRKKKLESLIAAFHAVSLEAVQGNKKSNTDQDTKAQMREYNYTSLIVRGAMPLEAFVIMNATYYGGEPVSESDFYPIITPMGLCYLFNGGFPKRTIAAAGRQNGLQLVLNTQLHEYANFGFEASIGFKIFVKQYGALPDVINEGIRVSPNTECDIGITQTVYTYLEAPLGNCNNSAELRYFDKKYVPYTRSACMDECLADIVNASCSCYIDSLSHPQTYQPCATMDQFTCAMVETAGFYQDYEMQASCTCSLECTITDYATTTFSSQLNPDYLMHLVPLLPKKLQLFNATVDGVVPLTNLQANLAKISIYFNKLKYEEIIQEEAYTVWAMLSDVGGAMGLFLGSALFTLAEIIDFALLHAFRKEKKMRHSPSPNITKTELYDNPVSPRTRHH